jgi:hypothetical protein
VALPLSVAWSGSAAAKKLLAALRNTNTPAATTTSPQQTAMTVFLDDPGTSRSFSLPWVMT